MKKLLLTIAILASVSWGVTRDYLTSTNGRYHSVYLKMKTNMRSDIGDIRVCDLKGNLLKYYIARNDSAIRIDVDFNKSVSVNTLLKVKWGYPDSATKEQDFRSYGFFSTDSYRGDGLSFNSTGYYSSIPRNGTDSTAAWGVSSIDWATDTVYFAYTGAVNSAELVPASIMLSSSVDDSSWSAPDIVWPANGRSLAATTCIFFKQSGVRKLFVSWYDQTITNHVTQSYRIKNLNTGVWGDTVILPYYDYDGYGTGTGVFTSDSVLGFCTYNFGTAHYWYSTNFAATWNRIELYNNRTTNGNYLTLEPSCIELKTNGVYDKRILVTYRSKDSLQNVYRLRYQIGTNSGRGAWGNIKPLDSSWTESSGSPHMLTRSKDGSKIYAGGGVSQSAITVSNDEWISYDYYNTNIPCALSRSPYNSIVDRGAGYIDNLWFANNGGGALMQYHISKFSILEKLYGDKCYFKNGKMILSNNVANQYIRIANCDSGINGCTTPYTLEFTYADTSTKRMSIGFQSSPSVGDFFSSDSLAFGFRFFNSKQITVFAKASDIDTTPLGYRRPGLHRYRMDYTSNFVNFYVDDKQVKSKTTNIPNKKLYFNVTHLYNSDSAAYFTNISVRPYATSGECYLRPTVTDSACRAFVSGKFIIETDTGMRVPIVVLPSRIVNSSSGSSNIKIIDTAGSTIKTYFHYYKNSDTNAYADIRLPVVNCGETQSLSIKYGATVNNNSSDSSVFSDCRFFNSLSDTVGNPTNAAKTGVTTTSYNAIYKDTGIVFRSTHYQGGSGYLSTAIANTEPSAFEISAWIRLDSYGQSGAGILYKSTDGTNGYGVNSDGGSNYKPFIGADTRVLNLQVWRFPLLKWIKITYQYSDSMRFFIDGLQVGSINYSYTNNNTAMKLFRGYTYYQAGKAERYSLSGAHNAKWQNIAYNLELNSKSVVRYVSDTVPVMIKSVSKLSVSPNSIDTIFGYGFTNATIAQNGITISPNLVNDSIVVFAPPAAGRVIVTNLYGLSDTTDTIKMTGPTITIQPQAANVNDYSPASFSVTATGTGVLSYQWRFRVANVGSNLSSYSFTPAYADSGYKVCVLITDDNGTTVSDTAVLTVTAIAAVITSQPSSIQRFIGQTATFSVAAYGTGTLAYQWKRNGVNISSATSNSYTTPTLDTSYNNAQYTCVITNSKSSTTSAIATLSLSHGPSINVQPQSITVNSGVLCTLSVTVTATGTPHYQWRKGNSNVGTDNRLYIFTSTYADSGSKYCVLINDDIANSVSDTAIVSVNKVLPTISVQPQSQTVYAGSYVTFNVTASNALSYQWRKNGSSITGATSSSYGPFLALIGDSGSKYMVVLTNTDGTKGSDTALLVVNSVPIDTTAEPLIESATPKTIYYGTIINIIGLDFGGIQGTLYCDSIPLSLITYWSDTLVHVTAPSTIPSGLHNLVLVKASGSADTLLHSLYVVNYTLQKLIGVIRNIDGTTPTNVKINIQPTIDNLSQSLVFSTKVIQPKIDINGYWETNVVCGSKLTVSIIVDNMVVSKKTITISNASVKDYYSY